MDLSGRELRFQLGLLHFEQRSTSSGLSRDSPLVGSQISPQRSQSGTRIVTIMQKFSPVRPTIGSHSTCKLRNIGAKERNINTASCPPSLRRSMCTIGA